MSDAQASPCGSSSCSNVDDLPIELETSVLPTVSPQVPTPANCFWEGTRDESSPEESSLSSTLWSFPVGAAGYFSKVTCGG
eukprot:CAMPEP_0115301550 /NCGR_PEP_ID=MMETSP0270-20121206/69917_1 /TAXON_ID=71861 /ORGANISM="Scrippsiella trochoidea, Strain CCMP3099" /LENGTH=80 /DNA_ID=CAMNT_0002719433 /DNA_START=468 /DNA_END=710 /DNA_ORIENTATION=-